MISEVEKRLKALFKKEHGFEINEDKISSYMDSLDVIEFVMNVEDEFGIEIPDSTLERIQTFQDLVILVEEIVYQGEVE